MQLIAITPPTSKLFINVAVQLYQKDANWIRPLDKDINDIFDDKKTKLLGLALCNAGFYRIIRGNYWEG